MLLQQMIGTALLQESRHATAARTLLKAQPAGRPAPVFESDTKSVLRSFQVLRSGGYKKPPIAEELACRVAIRTEKLFVHCQCMWTPTTNYLCVHAYAFLLEAQALLDAGKGPGTPWLAPLIQLAEAIHEQRMQRLVRLVRGAAPPKTSTESRVVWTIDPTSWSGVQLKVARSDRNRKGTWSAPKEVRRRDICDLLRSSPEPRDQAALKLIEAVRTTAEDEDWADVLSLVLPVLVGHPAVYLRRGGQVEVEARTPTIHIEVRDQDLVVTVDLGGIPLSRVRGGYLFDEAKNTLIVCQVSDRVRELDAVCSESNGFHVPREFGTRLIETLWELSADASIEVPREFAPREVEPDTRLRLLFERQNEGWMARLRVRPLGQQGQPLPPGEGFVIVTGLGQEGPIVTRRSLDIEGRQARDLAAWVPLPLGAPDWEAVLSMEQTLDLASRLGDRPDVVVEWPSKPPRLLVGRPTLRVQVGAAQDWFGVEGTAEIDGQTLALAHLVAARRRRQRFLEVSADTFVDLARVFDERLEKLTRATRDERGKLVLSRAAVADAPDLLTGVDEVRAHTDWSRLARRVTELRGWEPALPSNLQTPLRDYQLAGFRWLARLGRLELGALLADDMGLGKTVQAIAMLLERADGGPALVVAPTSVVPNWQRELQRFAPSLRVHTLRQADRGALLEQVGPHDIVLTTWGLLRFEQERLSGKRWHTLVFDEAQAIKTWSTDTARAARSLQADWRLALTGTPVENHLGELFSLLETVIPGLFGSWEGFQRRFASPIERGGGGPEHLEAQAALAALVRPFILRRKKSQVALELPSRTEVQLDVELSRLERQLYESERIRAVEAMAGLGDDPTGRVRVLAALTRLRQLASSAHLVDDAAPEESAKTVVLMEQLEALVAEDRSSLVFSQFTSQLALVSRALERRGIACLTLTGETPEAERQRRVDAFQRGESRVFLISLKAGGTGLNLTAADTVFLMDPWWNPAAEDQAADRAHRMGQTRPVTIVRLVARGTIEDKVLALHARKRRLVDDALEGTGAAERLSTSELVDLLRDVGGDGADTSLDPEESASTVSESRVSAASTASPDKASASRPRGEKSAKGAAGSKSIPGRSSDLSMQALREVLVRRWTAADLAPSSIDSYVAVVGRVLGSELPAGASLDERLERAIDAYASRPDKVRAAHRTPVKRALDAWNIEGLLSVAAVKSLLKRLPRPASE